MWNKKNHQMSLQVLPIDSNYGLPDIRSVPSRSVDHFFLRRTGKFPKKVLTCENCPLCVMGKNLCVIIGNIYVAILIPGNTRIILVSYISSFNLC